MTGLYSPSRIELGVVLGFVFSHRRVLYADQGEVREEGSETGQASYCSPCGRYGDARVRNKRSETNCFALQTRTQITIHAEDIQSSRTIPSK